MVRKKKPDVPDTFGQPITEAMVRDPANVRDFEDKGPGPLGYTGPKNADRADWAAAAVLKFATVTGMIENEDAETTIGDLLADLMHLCDREGVDFHTCVARASDHYEEEVSEEENDDGTAE